MSKFHLYCSCICCKQQTIAQNINTHYKKYHMPKDHRDNCIVCGAEVSRYSKRFCSQSCGAKYSNSTKDRTKFKPGPKKGTLHSRKLFTKISQCVICSKFHPGTRKTCSPKCKNKLLSDTMKNKIFNGFNPNLNRGRHKKSWMESSFGNWLNQHGITDYITEQPFKRKDITKTYFADFYFPQRKLVIELDGTQHNNTKEYDAERDNYIISKYSIEIIRIGYKEYQSGSRIDFIKHILGIKAQ